MDPWISLSPSSSNTLVTLVSLKHWNLPRVLGHMARREVCRPITSSNPSGLPAFDDSLS